MCPHSPLEIKWLSHKLLSQLPLGVTPECLECLDDIPLSFPAQQRMVMATVIEIANCDRCKLLIELVVDHIKILEPDSRVIVVYDAQLSYEGVSS